MMFTTLLMMMFTTLLSSKWWCLQHLQCLQQLQCYTTQLSLVRAGSDLLYSHWSEGSINMWTHCHTASVQIKPSKWQHLNRNSYPIQTNTQRSIQWNQSVQLQPSKRQHLNRGIVELYPNQFNPIQTHSSEVNKEKLGSVTIQP